MFVFTFSFFAVIKYQVVYVIIKKGKKDLS